MNGGNKGSSERARVLLAVAPVGHVYADLSWLRGDQARAADLSRQARRDDPQDFDDLPHLDACERADPSLAWQGGGGGPRTRALLRYRRGVVDQEGQVGV